MIASTSTSSLMSEDVTVRCRVIRRLCAGPPHEPTAVEELGESQEMTCTMRNWDRDGDYSGGGATTGSARSLLAGRRVAPLEAASDGPALLLTPLQDFPSNSSVRRSRSRNNSRSSLTSSTGSETSPTKHRAGCGTLTRDGRRIAPSAAIVIPLVDLHRCDLCHRRRSFDWTTGVHGSWHVQAVDQNAFDILLACLKARLPPARLVELVAESEESDIADVSHGETMHVKSSSSSRYQPNIHKSSSSVASSSCLDVDTLTAAHLRSRINQETISEKVSRRVSHVLATLGDWTAASGLTSLMEDLDAKCCNGGGGDYCCNNSHAATPINQNKIERAHEPTRSPRPEQHMLAPDPETPHAPHDLEQVIRRSFRYSDLEMDDNDSVLSGDVTKAAAAAAQLAILGNASSVMETVAHAESQE